MSIWNLSPNGMKASAQDNDTKNGYTVKKCTKYDQTIVMKNEDYKISSSLKTIWNDASDGRSSSSTPDEEIPRSFNTARGVGQTCLQTAIQLGLNGVPPKYGKTVGSASDTASNASNSSANSVKGRAITSRNGGYNPNVAIDNGNNTSTQTWSFGLNDYELVQEKVSHLHPDVTFEGLPKFVLNLMGEKDKREIDLLCLGKIEPQLCNQLLDFQKYGVAFGISTSGRCMIADDMGLGKTYVALAIADFYKDDFPLLICTTATARDGWVQHVRSLLPGMPSESIACWQSTQEYIGNVKVLVASYSLMDKNCDRLCEKNFGILILDESHTIKNFKAKTTSSAYRLGQKAKRVILLTGTPALSRPSELYCQLNLIDKKFFGNFKEYGLRYCAGKQSTFGFDCSGQSNLQELNLILRQKFMIRRTKEDVEFELGKKSRETITLDPDKVWSTSDLNIRKAAEKFKIFSKDFVTLKGAQRDELLLRFYSETAKLKANAVCGYIKKIIPEKNKFIVFAYHKVMLDAISDCLNKQNVDFIRIDGTTKSDLRSQYIDRFQCHKTCQVALLSLKACNAAITLTAASLVIFSELDWNPSTLAQCESRAHRIGQKAPVTCRYLLAKGTADDFIWEMLKRKQDVLNKAGLFSEDLTDATHTFAPVSDSNTLTQYFQPSSSSSKSEGNVKVNTEQEASNEKRVDDYKDMLDEEDDAMFMDLDY